MKTPRRETQAGYHVLNLFQLCPWKFYLRYICGFEPKVLAHELALGASFHEGKAGFLLRKKNPTKIALQALSEYKTRLVDQETYERCMYKVEIMLESWISEIGEGLIATYAIKEVEQEHRVELEDGYFMTIRPDAVLVSPSSKQLIINETKTTGFSIVMTELGVKHGDQLTAQWLALHQAYSSPGVSHALADITYIPRNSLDPGKVTNALSDPILRSGDDLAQFRMSATSLFKDMTGRAQAVCGRVNSHRAFPRNTQWCNSYNRECEYLKICRHPVDPRKVPAGFRRDPWSLESGLFSDVAKAQLLSKSLSKYRGSTRRSSR